MSPTANRIVRVVHQSPTRVRLRLDPGDDAAILAADVTDALSTANGIERVTPNETTRAVLIELDRARSSPDSVLAALRKAGIEAASQPPDKTPASVPQTRIGSAISRRMASANDRLSRSTRGYFNLKDVFPLTMIGFGVKSVLRGSVQAVPWYNLLYYGYTTFAMLHEHRSESEPDWREILRRRYARGEIDRAEFLRVIKDVGGQAD